MNSSRFGYPLGVFLALCTGMCARESAASIPVYGYTVVHSFPHDPTAFTEGLFYLDGYLYESTGLAGHSTIRKVRLTTGVVVQEVKVPSQYFGEGIVNWKSELISLTWKAQLGFVHDLKTLRTERRFSYAGEGWALTQDGTQIFMSDGTADLRVLNPDTLLPTGVIHVTAEGRAVQNLNELEWVEGEIYANVWQTDWILRIDPRDGRVIGAIDLAGLLPATDRVPGQTDVLNGIAYDATGHRLFVTGKNWPKLFEIRLIPPKVARTP